MDFPSPLKGRGDFWYPGCQPVLAQVKACGYLS